TIDLLLTDIIMPGGMNGRQLAEHVQAQYPAIKILYMSGYTDNVLTQHPRLVSVHGVLQKPFAPDALVRMVWDVLHVDEEGLGIRALVIRTQKDCTHMAIKAFGSQSMVAPLRRVLVKRPDAAFAVDDPATWHYTDRPDLALAHQEHDALAEILRGAGAEVIYH